MTELHPLLEPGTELLDTRDGFTFVVEEIDTDAVGRETVRTSGTRDVLRKKAEQYAAGGTWVEA